MRLRISTSVLLGLLLSIVVDHHRHGVTAWLYGPWIRTAYWPTTGRTGVRSSRASIRVVPNDPSRFPRNTCLAAQPNDEEECGEEEACEIDWSLMPGWDDESNPETASPESVPSNFVESETNAWLEEKEQQQQQQQQSNDDADNNKNNEDDDIDDEEILDTHGNVPSEQLRQRLEMQWRVASHVQDDNCDVYQPHTCGGEPCQLCRGRGWNDCRFCHGTSVLWSRPSLATPPTSCKICHQGVETCASCKGSGWIASWTDLQTSSR